MRSLIYSVNEETNVERRDDNELNRDLGREPAGADDVGAGDVDNGNLDKDGDSEGDVEGGDDLQSADDVGTARESA